MLQIMQKPDHWKYAGEAAFFLWLAWRVMKWVWKTSKEVQEEPAGALGQVLEKRTSHDAHDMDGA